MLDSVTVQIIIFFNRLEDPNIVMMLDQRVCVIVDGTLTLSKSPIVENIAIDSLDVLGLSVCFKPRGADLCIR